MNDYIYIIIILLLLLLLIKQKLRPKNSLGIIGAIGHWLEDRRNREKQKKALKDLGITQGETENIFKNAKKEPYKYNIGQYVKTSTGKEGEILARIYTYNYSGKEFRLINRYIIADTVTDKSHAIYEKDIIEAEN